MAWRGVHISQPAQLKLRHGQLHLISNGEDGDNIHLPLEDIAWIILDSPQITLSCVLLGALAERGIALVVPDSKHHPAGMLLSFHQHYAQSAIAHAQVAMRTVLQKRLWQKLVQAKINNQADVLLYLNNDYDATLKHMAARVSSGDTSNMEAQAARAYWSQYMHGFRRHADDRINALLNYGYAIIRAALARNCAAAGLMPAFGVHHKSQSNAFNLVDDLIEPFRPFVDLWAHKRMTVAAAEEFTLDDRRHMANILWQPAQLADAQLTIFVAAELMVASLVRAIEADDATLLHVPHFEPAT